ncbi:hypothetical protein ACFY9Y_22120 [Streptomyces fimicarius]|uniref:hypothetical protein n=1 Tax=Streptomyces griseus TaxID=1911 RepID=UPI0036ED1B04
MPEHKMQTIDGIRYRPEDVARARARAGAQAAALTVADAHLPGSKPTDGPGDQGDGGEEDTGGFNPAEHTILQVMAHLAEADENETARVLDLEEKTEARKGLTERRAELLEEARKRASGGGGR